MWRVLTGLNCTIQISFLPAGHTKFAPDCCFGLLKQKFRRRDVDSLLDFANVVNESASVNKAQLVGETNGNVVVPTYDWTSHFAVSFKKIVGIKVLSAEFYFHKPITVHLELYLFYRFIHFLLYIGQY